VWCRKALRLLGDAQVRLSIRTDYDANPNQTYRNRQDKFGVNYSMIILAMKRTADEWRAMLDASAARPAKPLASVSKVYSEAQAPSSIPVKRGRGRPPAAKPGAQQVAIPAQAASQPPAAIQAPARPATWEYKSIVVRGKADSGAATFEFQDSGSACWQLLGRDPHEPHGPRDHLCRLGRGLERRFNLQPQSYF
jgi:hypothetical protein